MPSSNLLALLLALVLLPTALPTSEADSPPPPTPKPPEPSPPPPPQEDDNPEDDEEQPPDAAISGEPRPMAEGATPKACDDEVVRRRNRLFEITISKAF